MTETNHKFDLEERTFKFAKSVRLYTKKLKVSPLNVDDIKQVIRSSGSVGANYIETNEALSQKDFLHRIKISRKEAKETTYWLRLMNAPDELLRIYRAKKDFKRYNRKIKVNPFRIFVIAILELFDIYNLKFGVYV